MRPFTEDFRERIVAAYEAGGVSLAAVGRRFGVSGKVVGKLVRQKRALGTLAPQVHRRGRKPAVSAEKKDSSCVSIWNNIPMRRCWNAAKHWG